MYCVPIGGEFRAMILVWERLSQPLRWIGHGGLQVDRFAAAQKRHLECTHTNARVSHTLCIVRAGWPHEQVTGTHL